MILSSKKVVSETRNMDEIEEKDISNLPVTLFIKILSLLPEVDANRICILSKQWEYFWALLPNLRFEMDNNWSIEQVNKFYDTVDQTLTLRDGMTLQRFLLKCSFDGYYYKRVYELFRKVVQCKVQVVDVDAMFNVNSFEISSFWDLLKTCNTLVELTLDGFELDFPGSELLFPCLKIIKLKSNYFSSDESFANLILGCPVLEELFMKSFLSDDVYTFKVYSPSLKRVSISFLNYLHVDEQVVIDAPILEYLDMLDCRYVYFLTKPLSLVEAHISICSYDIQSELFTSLSSAKLLTLTVSTVNVFLGVDGSNVPVFPNLVKLVINVFCINDWRFLLDLLNNMPNLEHITFDNFKGLPVYKCFSPYNGPVEVPECIRVKMKEIIIHKWNRERKDERTFIKYLLKHAKNLEMLKVGSELWYSHYASSSSSIIR